MKRRRREKRRTEWKGGAEDHERRDFERTTWLTLHLYQWCAQRGGARVWKGWQDDGQEEGIVAVQEDLFGRAANLQGCCLRCGWWGQR